MRRHLYIGVTFSSVILGSEISRRGKTNKSEVSFVRGKIGLEFKQASTSQRRVENSSNVKIVSPTTLFRWCFVDLTAASQMPAKCGAPGGLKRQAVPCSYKAEPTERAKSDSLVYMRRSSASAPMKLSPGHCATKNRGPDEK